VYFCCHKAAYKISKILLATWKTGKTQQDEFQKEFISKK